MPCFLILLSGVFCILNEREFRGEQYRAEFEYKAWRNRSDEYKGADGFSVFLFDATVPFRIGGFGGSLGYAYHNKVKVVIEPIGTDGIPKYLITVDWTTAPNGDDRRLLTYETEHPIPESLKLGFAASTGGGFNFHEISSTLTDWDFALNTRY